RIERAGAVAAALVAYDDALAEGDHRLLRARRPVQIPATVDEDLGALLGYLVGDGHISRVKRHIGLTTGDAPQAARFARIAHRLFGVESRLRLDGNRWRVLVH